MSRRLLSTYLLALTLVGCGNAEPLRETQLGVFGGAPAPDDEAVLAVVNFTGGQCSSSLIAPNLLLTARHCVAHTEGKELQVECGKTKFEPADSSGAIFVVPLPKISEDPKDYLAVDQVSMPPDLGDDLCGTDVVLVRLKKPLKDVVPLIPRLDTPVTVGETYASVGYGLDESLKDMPSGERKRLNDLSVACSGEDCGEQDVRSNEWVGSGGPCRGDSGGPALDESGQVIGVVSRGNAGCKQPVFGDVATRATWLREQARAAAAHAHLAPPAWACTTTSPCDEPDDAPEATCAFAPVAHTASRSAGAALLLGLALLGRRRRQARHSQHSCK